MTLGCPGPDEDPDACPRPGDALAITLSPNQADSAGTLVDGGRVPVFPPPQGGVFTELDVRLTGLADDDLEQLRVDVVAADDGRRLAAQLYFGRGLPLTCDPDGALTITALPVGFDDAIVLAELDEVPVVLTATVETAHDTLTEDLAVTLFVSDY
jgi:hypothetical protein